MENAQTSLPKVQFELAQKLDTKVFQVLGNQALQGFERAFAVASAINELKSLLTPEYMKPIMALQGNKIGFKTDKDKEGGYPENVVKNCLIEAVLFGLQPTGNEFNIIAGNTYATKEGMGALLKKLKGLDYDIVFELPRIKDESAAIVAVITWNFNGVHGEKKLDLPIKLNKFMGADAVIGKATRKARHWLYTYLTGSEIGEGEITDVAYVDVTPEKPSQEAKEIERLNAMIDGCKTIAELKALKAGIAPEKTNLLDIIGARIDQFTIEGRS